MKGNISLVDFIREVKTELKQAQVEPNQGFFTLDEAQLEVSFALEAEGGGKFKFLVFDAGAKATAKQLHKVTLKFKPLAGASETIVETRQLKKSSAGAVVVAKKRMGPKVAYAPPKRGL